MAQLYFLPQHRALLITPHAWKLHTPAGNDTTQLLPRTLPVITLLAAETVLDSERGFAT